MEQDQFKIPFSKAEFCAAIEAIDPETAEVTWHHRDVFDPYGLGTPETSQVGRDYYVRATAAHPWIWFGDLPKDLRNELEERHSRQLASSAKFFE